MRESKIQGGRGAVLGRYARRVLAERGVKVADYLTHVYGTADGGWHGDRCGCPDDRCRDGYHHDGGDDECRCLPAELDHMLGEGVWAPGVATTYAREL